jgi:hypothetical protein
MNMSDATLGAVTPLKSGMPFQSRRSKGPVASEPVLNRSIRLRISERTRLTPLSPSADRSHVFHPFRRFRSSLLVGPTIVQVLLPMLKGACSLRTMSRRLGPFEPGILLMGIFRMSGAARRET